MSLREIGGQGKGVGYAVGSLLIANGCVPRRAVRTEVVSENVRMGNHTLKARIKTGWNFGESFSLGEKRETNGILGAVRLFRMILQRWVQVIIHFSKPTECRRQRMNSKL